LKNTLNKHTNVGKDSVTAFARAGGIFIIYLTACANDFARENRRQTITANDVLAAIKVRSICWKLLYFFSLAFRNLSNSLLLSLPLKQELEFDEFVPELTAFLDNYRQLEKNKKNAKAKAAAAKAEEEASAADGGDLISSAAGSPAVSTSNQQADEEDDEEENSKVDDEEEEDDGEDDEGDGDVSMADHGDDDDENDRDGEDDTNDEDMEE
jgi:DNA polymerase epsilon subunit 3